MIEPGSEPYVHVTQFVSGDAEGAEQESWTETPERIRLTEPKRRRSTWLDFQGHASMPAATTEIDEEEIEIPAGRFACLRYTRREGDAVSTFWFARSAPGMPLKFEEHVERRTRVLVDRDREHRRNPVSWYAGPVKVTIDVDPELYRAVKVEAARGDRSVREIVDEALGAWLDAAETEEDRASAEAALIEYRRDGGEAADSFFGSLAAETRAAYGPPGDG